MEEKELFDKNRFCYDLQSELLSDNFINHVKNPEIFVVDSLQNALQSILWKINNLSPKQIFFNRVLVINLKKDFEVIYNVNNFFQEKNERIPLLLTHKTVDIKDILKIVSQEYSFFKKIKSAIIKETKLKNATLNIEQLNVKRYENLGDNDWKIPILGFIRFANQNFRDYLLTCCIHGSSYDLNYSKNFSDFDTHLIIKEKTILDPEKFYKLWVLLSQGKKFIYGLTPFQHHSYFLCTELDMNYYPQKYFPLILFEHSGYIFRKEKLNFSIRDSELERKEIFYKKVIGVHDAHVTGSKILNLQNLQAALSGFFIMFPFFSQLYDKYCYKPDSFKFAKEKLPDLDWKFFNQMTELRHNFRNLDVNLKLLRIMNHKVGIYPSKFINRLYTDVRNNIHNFAELDDFYNKENEIATILLKKAIQDKII